MHAISSYRVDRPTNKQRPLARPLQTQTGPITIHYAAKLSAQCKNTQINTLQPGRSGDNLLETEGVIDGVFLAKHLTSTGK